MAEITRWEYTSVTFGLVDSTSQAAFGLDQSLARFNDLGDSTRQGAFGLNEWIAHLNDLGDQGWEAVGPVPHWERQPDFRSDVVYTLLMKRPKATEDWL